MRATGSPKTTQAADRPTDRTTKDTCSNMVTNLKIMVVNLYSTGLTRGYAGEIGIQMVTNNLNRKYNL